MQEERSDYPENAIFWDSDGKSEKTAYNKHLITLQMLHSYTS